MAVGKRPEGRQEELFVATSEIRRLSHPFYQALERMLKTEGFDAFSEKRAANSMRRKTVGRDSAGCVLPHAADWLPGRDRFGTWDCVAVRGLDFAARVSRLRLAKNPPDHSSVSRTRRRLSLEAHEAVFGWVLERLRSSGLLDGKTLGVDSTTLEANAALRSIVRRDDGPATTTGWRNWRRRRGSRRRRARSWRSWTVSGRRRDRTTTGRTRGTPRPGSRR